MFQLKCKECFTLSLSPAINVTSACHFTLLPDSFLLVEINNDYLR